MNETLARYQKMVEQFPDNELARFSLGKAYYDLGQFGDAKEQFELAISRKPDWMAVQILLGKCAVALGESATARLAFERAIFVGGGNDSRADRRWRSISA